MTDHADLLHQVEEAAEKARESLAALALEVPAPVWDHHAELVKPFLDLPYRAIREELERLRAVEAAARTHVDDPWSKRGLLALESALRPDPAGSEGCTAALWHGPGHQSKTLCRETGEHSGHSAIYGPARQYAEWRGGDAMTGYFDEPPEDGDED